MIQAPQNCVVEAKSQSNFGSRGVNDATTKSQKEQRMLARSEWERRRGAPKPFGVVAVRRRYLALAQRLSWRSFAVSQNFSNRRRKVLDAGTGHNDAVAAAVGFLGDAQEFPAVVLPELHVEMLALDLQLSRLDNVIHFYLRPPTLPHPV